MQRLDIAMIMDGNRRWAESKGLPKVKGHEYGAKKLEEVLKWVKEKNLNSLTVYTFSTENFNRKQEEVDYIFKLFVKYFSDVEKRLNTPELKGLKINFLGRLSMFPENIQEICKRIIEKTKNNGQYTLQFCFGYGGRSEIVDSVKELIKKGIPENEITEDLIQENLYSGIEPDIIIRTSGEQRLSNFLMWQSAYSEWFFIDTPWPAFSKTEFETILTEFDSRDRRKGK